MGNIKDSDKIKLEIEGLTYAEMVEVRRFAPIGHKYFSGETGDFFKEEMTRKRKSISAEEQVVISKRIGFER